MSPRRIATTSNSHIARLSCGSGFRCSGVVLFVRLHGRPSFTLKHSR